MPKKTPSKIRTIKRPDGLAKRFRWAAKDYNGWIFAYLKKPVRNYSSWTTEPKPWFHELSTMRDGAIQGSWETSLRRIAP